MDTTNSDLGVPHKGIQFAFQLVLLLLHGTLHTAQAGEDIFDLAPSGKTGKTVNLRKETSTSSALVARIAVGSRVYILEDLGQWCRIGYGNDEGYMLSNYLEYDGQTDETDGKGLSDDDRAKIDGALKSIEQACDVIGGIVGRG